MISNAVKELQSAKNEILANISSLQKEIGQIDSAIAALSGLSGGSAVEKPAKKYTMTPAHRKALAKAREARWAKYNAAKAAQGAKPAKKKTMSAAARKKLSEFQKKLWAAKKAAQAKAAKQK